MPEGNDQPDATEHGPHVFATTHWSVVLTAGRGESAEAAEALEDLCRAYWPPLYAYARWRGYSQEAAEDLTQGFFAEFLRRGSLGAVSKDRGKFRSFLLASMNHFLANEWDRAQRRKRGGGIEVIPLDVLMAEQRFQREPADTLTPEKLFDRQWAQLVLERVLGRLREEFGTGERQRRFERLKSFLMGEEDSGSLQQAGIDLGLTEEAVKASVHRLRQRYRQLLRTEIAATVVESAEIDAEIRYLISCLRD